MTFFALAGKCVVPRGERMGHVAARRPSLIHSTATRGRWSQGPSRSGRRGGGGSSRGGVWIRYSLLLSIIVSRLFCRVRIEPGNSSVPPCRLRWLVCAGVRGFPPARYRAALTKTWRRSHCGSIVAVAGRTVRDEAGRLFVAKASCRDLVARQAGSPFFRNKFHQSDTGILRKHPANGTFILA